MAKTASKTVAPVLDQDAIAELVDKIGLLKAVLAPQLEQLEADLNKLKAQGVARYEGKLYEVNVFEQEQNRLDMEAVRAKLSPQFIAAHTTTKVVRIGKVSSRKLAVA